ncbi:uncharacterized protein DUF1842 [Chitinophaga dinghuensis]|uniref:Uncharacterized protein DUF1842 n=1 Tax=Chitinophaga dinghuensis TaxID=1539050 RepID=A0A327VJU2_9BACT|nr:DUF1842 domain-containing protein [Chitinophaga dinghuensis]RAJ74984.1 uncharacterized protein DUF1842 [Chitinophaga dinghuensis]
MSNNVSKTGLFVVQFQIGTGNPGGQELHLSLTVNTVTRQISGMGTIAQAINPPLDIQTYVKGNYFLLPILPPATYPINLNLTGVPFLVNPLSNVAVHPNTEIYLNVSERWETGICTYKYEINGHWQTVSNVPVKIVQTEVLTPAL